MQLQFKHIVTKFIIKTKDGCLHVGKEGEILLVYVPPQFPSTI